jgi:hypothetical protein
VVRLLRFSKPSTLFSMFWAWTQGEKGARMEKEGKSQRDETKEEIQGLPTWDPSLPTGAFILSLNKLSYLLKKKEGKKKKEIQEVEREQWRKWNKEEDCAAQVVEHLPSKYKAPRSKKKKKRRKKRK